MIAQKIVVDELIEEARKHTGLQKFDSESFREGLEILVTDINADAGRGEVFVKRFRDDLVKTLMLRLKVTDYLENRSEIRNRPIERPVFVFGIPRTGTTLLSNLLAVDPARRAPLAWETQDPVPPPKKNELYTDPRALIRLEGERAMLSAKPEIGKYFRFSAIYPTECTSIHGQDFKTLMWEARGRLPGYREFVMSRTTDVTSAYQYEHKFLQLLQADAPGIWSLKMPSHSLFIPTLLEIFPDARLVWTHRDPYTATGSLCSLIAVSHNVSMGTVDREWIGWNYPLQAAEHASRAMEFRQAIGWDRFIDVHYANLVSNPISAMQELYEKLGDDFTPEAGAAMRGWLTDNPQGKFGRHEYELAEYGISKDKLDPMFADYLNTFEIKMDNGY